MKEPLACYEVSFPAVISYSLWFHDVRFPPEGRAYKKKRNHGHDRV